MEISEAQLLGLLAQFVTDHTSATPGEALLAANDWMPNANRLLEYPMPEVGGLVEALNAAKTREEQVSILNASAGALSMLLDKKKVVDNG
jgi:hypothetical protein